MEGPRVGRAGGGDGEKRRETEIIRTDYNITGEGELKLLLPEADEEKARRCSKEGTRPIWGRELGKRHRGFGRLEARLAATRRCEAQQQHHHRFSCACPLRTATEQQEATLRTAGCQRWYKNVSCSTACAVQLSEWRGSDGAEMNRLLRFRVVVSLFQVQAD